MKDLKRIERKITELHEKILEKRPSHFRIRDIVNAFFASLVVGLVFIFKGSLFDIAIKLTTNHLVAIVILTLVILTSEIYFIGYSRVKRKKERKFCQFWLKRLVTLYVIAIIISLFLVYLFGINYLVHTNYEVLKVVVALSMPCAVGAAVPSLLKQY
jgi:uncharacterized membrane protein